MKTFNLIIFFCYFFSVFMLAGANPFNDSSTNKVCQELERLSDKGLLQGVSPSFLKGSRPLTRYEIAFVLAGIVAKIEKMGTDKQAKQFLLWKKADFSASSYLTSQDIVILNRLLNEYTEELNKLGIRAKNARDVLKKLSRRAKELEKLKVSGSLSSTLASLSLNNPFSLGAFDYSFNYLPVGTTTSNRLAGGIPIHSGTTSAVKMNLNISKNFTKSLSGGIELDFYSNLGTPALTPFWVIPPPLGQYSSGLSGQLNRFWVRNSFSMADINLSFGAFYPKMVSNFVFCPPRYPSVFGPRFVPLAGIDLSINLLGIVQCEFFTATNLANKIYPNPLLTSDNNVLGSYGSVNFGKYMLGSGLIYVKEGFLNTTKSQKITSYIAEYELGIKYKLFVEYAATDFYPNKLESSYFLIKGTAYRLGVSKYYKNGSFLSAQYLRIAPHYDPLGYHEKGEFPEQDKNYLYHAKSYHLTQPYDEWAYSDKRSFSYFPYSAVGPYANNRQGISAKLFYPFERFIFFVKGATLKQVEPSSLTADSTNLDSLFPVGLNNDLTKGRYYFLSSQFAWKMGQKMLFRFGCKTEKVSRQSPLASNFISQNTNINYLSLTQTLNKPLFLTASYTNINSHGFFLTTAAPNISLTENIPALTLTYQVSPTSTFQLHCRRLTFADKINKANNYSNYSLISEININF